MELFLENKKLMSIKSSSRKKWTKEDDKMFIELYPNTSNRFLALKFGVTPLAIKNHSTKLGILKSKKYMSDTKNRACFQKGNKPFNKGVKGFMNANITSFKKGDKPHNTKEKGHLSLRMNPSKKEQYIYIKLSDRNWELYHRYLWKKEFGKILKGMIVTFKDGNQLNCVIDNLELISRAENLKRNLNRDKAIKTRLKRSKIKRIRELYNF